MRNNLNNLKTIINYLDNSIKKQDYSFEYLSKIFNEYFISIYNNYFTKKKPYDNKLVYEIRDYAMLDGGIRLRPLIMFLTSYRINSLLFINSWWFTLYG